jgi:hypothetical protein
LQDRAMHGCWPKVKLAAVPQGVTVGLRATRDGRRGPEPVRQMGPSPAPMNVRRPTSFDGVAEVKLDSYHSRNAITDSAW